MKLPYKILVLDDDDSALDGIVEMLREMGYVVTPAATYDSAKTLLAAETFDLLITDIRLRGFNGLNLVRQAYRDRPEMGLIIISGYEETMMEVEAGRYGAQFVRKPIKPVEFLKTVARCLGDVRRQRRQFAPQPARYARPQRARRARFRPPLRALAKAPPRSSPPGSALRRLVPDRREFRS